MSEILDMHSLKALSTDTRQDIMKLLAKRPHTPSEISRLLGKHVTTVSEHLGVLESSGLVQRREDGHKWVYYILTAKGEKIFKPAFYSWVVALSLSLIVFIVGIQQVFFASSYRAMGTAQDSGRSLAEYTAGKAATYPAPYPLLGIETFIGIVLVSSSMLCLGYLIGRKVGYSKTIPA